MMKNILLLLCAFALRGVDLLTEEQYFCFQSTDTMTCFLKSEKCEMRPVVFWAMDEEKMLPDFVFQCASRVTHSFVLEESTEEDRPMFVLDVSTEQEVTKIIMEFLKKGVNRAAEQLRLDECGAANKSKLDKRHEREYNFTRKNILLRIMQEQLVTLDNIKNVIEQMQGQGAEQDSELRALRKVLDGIMVREGGNELLKHDLKMRKNRLARHRHLMKKKRSCHPIHQQLAATDERESAKAEIEDYGVESYVDRIEKATSQNIGYDDPATSMDDGSEAHIVESDGLGSAFEVALLNQELEGFVPDPFLTSHVPLQEISELESAAESREIIAPIPPFEF